MILLLKIMKICFMSSDGIKYDLIIFNNENFVLNMEISQKITNFSLFYTPGKIFLFLQEYIENFYS